MGLKRMMMITIMMLIMAAAAYDAWLASAANQKHKHVI